MNAEEAARAARIRLGGATQLREANRELRGLPWLETLFQDLRFALRMLRKNPGFTAVAVLTLAIGIGANTAIFSVVYAVLLEPLPYPHSAQLYSVFQHQEKDASQQNGWSYLNFKEFRETNHIFSEMAGNQFHQLTLTGRGEPSVVDTAVVTAEYFDVFGVAPLAGRTFTPEDGKPGAPAVAVLSEALWRGHFGSDPTVVGSSINLDQRPFTVVGIMPAFFRVPVVNRSEKVWIPLAQDPLFGPWMPRRGGHWLGVTARLKPGVSLAQAQAEMDTIGARLAQEFPNESKGWLISAAPLQQVIVGNVKTALIVLLCAVGLVLLIACANIANLLLARATSRTREIAVRAALGAGRSRIVRQLMSETTVLGFFGGIAGVLLAFWGVHAIALLPSGLPQVNTIRVDYYVLGFAVLLTMLATCVFGLAPAFFVAISDLQDSLRDGDGRSGEAGKHLKARGFLAAGEVALALVLLLTAGLLIRSFARLTSVDPGFRAEHLLKTDVSLPQFQYSTPQQWIAFSDRLLTRLQSEPGLGDSAFAVPLPLTDGFVNLAFDIVGAPVLRAAESRTANYVSVSPEYFRIMGIPLLSGRSFTRNDILSSPHVALISRAMAAERYFPAADPIGRQVSVGIYPFDSGAPREIIGVVGDVRDTALGKPPAPMIYVPFDQAPYWGWNIIVRTTLDSATAAAAIRRDVSEIDKGLPVSKIEPFAEMVDATVAQARFRTYLLAGFAGVALLLSATGIFGVISYSVARRTREIGLRMALGASRVTVLRLIFRETLLLTAAGLGVGLPCAFLASRLVRQMLFEVSAGDPATVAGVVALLVAHALLAAYIPVRRAMAVNPSEALRHT